MLVRTRSLFAKLVLLAIALVGCAPAGVTTPTIRPTLPLIEFIDPTATPTVAASLDSEALLPTATPFIYTVVANDTLFGIAASLNVSLDALIAANPGLDPRALSPGTQIVIPTGSQAALTTALPTITPVVSDSGEPNCFTTNANELWCFVMVVNDSDLPLESVTGVVQLFSASGDLLASLEAVPPLNTIAAGAQMPLVAYAEEAPFGWVNARAQVLTAFQLATEDEHYLTVDSVEFDFSVASSGAAAHVTGSALVDGSASLVWVLAVAYDANDKVVGVRRWESAGDLDFDFWVYSLGPAIADVQILIEARP